jgi:hypothetical protein
MMWFGSTWGAPVNEESTHVSTPVGIPCAHCDEPIAEGDQGYLIPAFRTASEMEILPWHFECHMREVVGSVGHLQKKCHCFGGTESDPPGMTKRQAAAAAWGLFNQLQGQGEA